MGTVDEQGKITQTPDRIAGQVEFIRQQRSSDSSFEVAVDGVTRAGERSLPAEYAGAGATWWFEAIHLSRGTEAELLQRIEAGPPV
jgi:hypothetical protein